MPETKALLIVLNGLKCMLCGKEFKYEDLNWHHIKPKAVSQFLNEEIDDSYDNGALLCTKSHEFVHKYNYWSYEYQNLMFQIRLNKKDISNMA